MQKLKFCSLCLQGDALEAYRALGEVNLLSPWLLQFSGGPEAMGLYWRLLHDRFGTRFLRRIFECEFSSRALLDYAFRTTPIEDYSYLVRRNCRVSSQALCYIVNQRIVPHGLMISRSYWNIQRLKAKKLLGVLVQAMWSGGLVSIDAIFSVCQFCSLPFTPPELRLLIDGFVGRDKQEPGYRRVILRRTRIAV